MERIDTWNVERTAEQLGQFVTRLNDERFSDIEL